MRKKCDHTSVGMLVWKSSELLLIKRKRPPFGFAAPAGHVDGDTNYEIAARRELEEEVGLKAISLRLIKEEDISNQCYREGGTWHHWKVYEVKVEGKLEGSKDETIIVGWFTKEEIKQFALRTEAYLTGKIKQKDWEISPGLEITWYYLLKNLA